MLIPILKQDGIKYSEINEKTPDGKKYIDEIHDFAIEKLGYFLKPSELFSQLAEREEAK